jgi:signal transduction histidine kinase
MQKRSNIYLICKEAINNAIKYSECSNLNFALQQQDHHINISIVDDGKGFDVLENFDGNGLKNMQSRAKEIKADLKMNSEKGKGTSINLSFKIT